MDRGLEWLVYRVWWHNSLAASSRFSIRGCSFHTKWWLRTYRDPTQTVQNLLMLYQPTNSSWKKKESGYWFDWRKSAKRGDWKELEFKGYNFNVKGQLAEVAIFIYCSGLQHPPLTSQPVHSIEEIMPTMHGHLFRPRVLFLFISSSSILK